MKRIFPFFLLLFFLIVGCSQSNTIDESNSSINKQVISSGSESVSGTKKDSIEAHVTSQQPDGHIVHDSGIEVGQVPPSLALETLSGKIFSDSELKDKKVIINFWASWCGPCRTEMPDLVRLSKEHPDDLLVIAVNIEEDKETVSDFVKEFNMEFPVLLDSTGELAEQFHILALPTTYILNSKGEIASKHNFALSYSQLAHAYQNVE
jgi:thiol-disulfide isomerase/thioredoxin